MVIGEPLAWRPCLAMASYTVLKPPTMVSKAESHSPEPDT
jgi:hypothetical protein